MKVVGKLSLVIVLAPLVVLIACSKGGDNNQPAPQPPRVVPGNYPPGTYPGAGYAPGSVPPGNILPEQSMANPNSIDIHDGHVFARELRVFQGRGHESSEDNCGTESNSYHHTRFYFNDIRRKNLLLNFDMNGNLNVTVISPTVEAHSYGPVPYDLNSDRRSIDIYPFDLHGSPSQEFVSMKMRQRAAQMRVWRDPEISYGHRSGTILDPWDGPSIPYVMNDMPTSGFVNGAPTFNPDYRISQQPVPGQQYGNQYPAPGYPPQGVPPQGVPPQPGQPGYGQMAQGQGYGPQTFSGQTGGYQGQGTVDVSFPNGLRIYVQVGYRNPQHIQKGYIHKGYFESSINIYDNNGGCATNAQTELEAVVN